MSVTAIDQRQRELLMERLQSDPSYRLAFEDTEFLMENDLRPVRLQLELLKPELYLREHKIHSTIVVFGSVRTIPPEEAQQKLEDLLQKKSVTGHNDDLDKAIPRARKQVRYSHYYSEALRFAQMISDRFQREHRRDFVVVTGGGPGIMEAANRGAEEARGVSVAFNITLPQIQAPNPYITQGLCFQFHYFALRKMHFLLRAKALVAFPGGFGTLDELFEALTLLQTQKIPLMPVVLVGKEFWEQAIRFDFLLQEGMIEEKDLQLFSVVDTADEAVNILHNFYHGNAPF